MAETGLQSMLLRKVARGATMGPMAGRGRPAWGRAVHAGFNEDETGYGTEGDEGAMNSAKGPEMLAPEVAPRPEAVEEVEIQTLSAAGEDENPSKGLPVSRDSESAGSIFRRSTDERSNDAGYPVRALRAEGFDAGEPAGEGGRSQQLGGHGPDNEKDFYPTDGARSAEPVRNHVWEDASDGTAEQDILFDRGSFEVFQGADFSRRKGYEESLRTMKNLMEPAKDMDEGEGGPMGTASPAGEKEITDGGTLHSPKAADQPMANAFKAGNESTLPDPESAERVGVRDISPNREIPFSRHSAGNRLPEQESETPKTVAKQQAVFAKPVLKESADAGDRAEPLHSAKTAISKRQKGDVRIGTINIRIHGTPRQAEEQWPTRPVYADHVITDDWEWACRYGR